MMMLQCSIYQIIQLSTVVNVSFKYSDVKCRYAVTVYFMLQCVAVVACKALSTAFMLI